MLQQFRVSVVVYFVTVCMQHAVLAQQKDDDSIAKRIVAPKGWTGEVIKLPPAFAPDMKMKGEEHIRFAPGMFKADADDFFSYAFVFEVPSEEALTLDHIQSDLLVYYRGLSKAVWKKKDTPLDVDKFKLVLEEIHKIEKEQTGTFYAGDLFWKEPFATSADQTLHMEVQSWYEPKSKNAYLFICVSPKDPTAEIWKTMRKIRAEFHQ